VDDSQILRHIEDLVEEEHRLRRLVQHGELTSEQENARLRAIEVALDQAWDLLRRRRASRAAGENPDSVEARPASEVEGYLQ
jgi:hypothetical protein